MRRPTDSSSSRGLRIADEETPRALSWHGRQRSGAHTSRASAAVTRRKMYYGPGQQARPGSPTRRRRRHGDHPLPPRPHSRRARGDPPGPYLDGDRSQLGHGGHFVSETSPINLVLGATDLEQVARVLTSDHARDSAGVRSTVLTELARRVDLDPVPLLADVLVHDPEANVRAAAAQTLRRLPSDERAKDALVTAVDSDDAENVVLLAAQALHRLRSPDAVRSFARLLKQGNLRARILAINALAEIPTLDAGRALATGMTDRRSLIATMSSRALVKRGAPEDRAEVQRAIDRAGWRRRRALARTLR